MKRVLSSLLLVPFLCTQVWALAGGPYDSSFIVRQAAFSGMYGITLSGTSFQNASDFDPLSPNPLRSIQQSSTGIMAMAIPTSGPASGKLLIFSAGLMYLGNAQGVVDSKNKKVTLLSQVSHYTARNVSNGVQTQSGVVVDRLLSGQMSLSFSMDYFSGTIEVAGGANFVQYQPMMTELAIATRTENNQGLNNQNLSQNLSNQKADNSTTNKTSNTGSTTTQASTANQATSSSSSSNQDSSTVDSSNANAATSTTSGNTSNTASNSSSQDSRNSGNTVATNLTQANTSSNTNTVAEPDGSTTSTQTADGSSTTTTTNQGNTSTSNASTTVDSTKTSGDTKSTDSSSSTLTSATNQNSGATSNSNDSTKNSTQTNTSGATDSNVSGSVNSSANGSSVSLTSGTTNTSTSTKTATVYDKNQVMQPAVQIQQVDSQGRVVANGVESWFLSLHAFGLREDTSVFALQPFIPPSDATAFQIDLALPATGGAGGGAAPAGGNRVGG